MDPSIASDDPLIESVEYDENAIQSDDAAGDDGMNENEVHETEEVHEAEEIHETEEMNEAEGMNDKEEDFDSFLVDNQFLGFNPDELDSLFAPEEEDDNQLDSGNVDADVYGDADHPFDGNAIDNAEDYDNDDDSDDDEIHFVNHLTSKKQQSSKRPLAADGSGSERPTKRRRSRAKVSTGWDSADGAPKPKAPLDGNPACSVPRSCPQCDENFATTRLFKVHLKTAHPDFKLYSCTYCTQAFRHSNSLTVHMRTHTGEPSPHTCAECGRGFSNSRNLKYHIKLHANERPYKCPECAKGFSAQWKLNNHLSTHSKPYHCVTCDLRFSKKHGLTDHEKSLTHVARARRALAELRQKKEPLIDMEDHEKPANESDKPANTLTPWEEEEARLDSLYADVKEDSTSMGRPFLCSRCQKTYRTLVQLKNHLRYHHKVLDSRERIPCNLCNQTFARLSNYKDHLKSKAHELRVIHENAKMRQAAARGEAVVSSAAGGLNPSALTGGSGVVKFTSGNVNHIVVSTSKASTVTTTTGVNGAKGNHLVLRIIPRAPNSTSAAEVKAAARKDWFKCLKCPQCFSTYDNLKYHLKNSHWKGVAYVPDSSTKMVEFPTRTLKRVSAKLEQTRKVASQAKVVVVKASSKSSTSVPAGAAKEEQEIICLD